MSKQHLIKRALAGGLVIASVGAPASAQAMRTEGPGPGHVLWPVNSYSSRALHPDASAAPAGTAHVMWPVNGYSSRALHPDRSAGLASVQPSSRSGFQWGDAGIVAAGAVALMGAAAAGVGVTRRRRTEGARVG